MRNVRWWRREKRHRINITKNDNKHTSLTLFLCDNMCSDGAGVRFYLFIERGCNLFLIIFFKRQKLFSYY